ncbi:kidney mitochondrial carrier protein 1 isoform X1 [Halichoerus grypus]
MRFKEKPYRRLCFSVPGEGTVVKMSALNWKPFVYGGLASITAECGTFPIDLTKTRLQIQGQTNDANFKEIRYRGMLHALVRIGREEGLKALYSGIAPAMLRQASYGTIKIGIYQSLKRLFVEHPEDETLLINVVCGILSGVVSSTIANPTDVLKIRMQAQSSTFQGGMIGNFINIYQQEGARGLWKGVSLTAQRAAIVVGVELPVYDLTKKHLILSGLMGDTVYTHFLSSFTCGLAGALASNPVDVVRTRMMNQRVLRDGRCSGHTGTLDCLLQNSLFWKVCPAQRSPELVRGDVIFEEALGAGVRGFRDISAVVVLFQADLGKAHGKTF